MANKAKKKCKHCGEFMIYHKFDCRKVKVTKDGPSPETVMKRKVYTYCASCGKSTLANKMKGKRLELGYCRECFAAWNRGEDLGTRRNPGAARFEVVTNNRDYFPDGPQDKDYENEYTERCLDSLDTSE